MPTSGPGLELAVLRAQGGDEIAFDALVTACHPALLRHARRHLGDPELARDATQDAWCGIVRGLRRLDDPARFVPWALCIVAARAVDIARRRARSPGGLGGSDGETAAGVAASAAGAESDDGERLRAAVARLDLDHRVTVELHYLEGLSLLEVAEATAAPVGTVKSRLFHARAKLRSVLGETESDKTRSR